MSTITAYHNSVIKKQGRCYRRVAYTTPELATAAYNKLDSENKALVLNGKLEYKFLIRPWVCWSRQPSLSGKI